MIICSRKENQNSLPSYLDLFDIKPDTFDGIPIDVVAALNFLHSNNLCPNN